MDSIKTIRLANSIRCGSREDYLFYGDHTEIAFFAIKIPVLNGLSGETTYQPVMKLTDKKTGRHVFTSLMNTIYWEMPEGHEYTYEGPSRFDETKEQLKRVKEKRDQA